MEKKVLDKLDGLDNRLDRIEIVQVEQAKDLKHHIARTDALQEMLIPIYKRDQQLIGIFKFVLSLSVLLGIIKGIQSLL